MPSQHDYLVDDKQRERLRRRESPAEIWLAERYNRNRRPERQIDVPASGGRYKRYDGRLLALLWALADNAEGLHVLSRQHGWTGPDPPGYDDMKEPLLRYLWEWGRDGQALEALWTRRGWLPADAIDAETPDAVLGFLWWCYRRPDARDELFRRYHLGGATDAAQDRALTLLLVIDRWDYERYATLDSLLSVSSTRRRIDRIRHHDRAPRIDQDEAENAAGGARPDAPVVDRDYVETNVPLEVRCLHKIRVNSEEWPLDLTAEELDYLARRNRQADGDSNPSGPSLARERTRIVEWMARHPEPTEEQIQECFSWFRQSGLARQTRQWRLHWMADENDRLLSPLLTGGGETISHLACVVQDSMDELARRTQAAGRGAQDHEHGPVLLFAGLVDAAQHLRRLLDGRRLNNGRLANLGAWQTNLRDFLAAFPILVKLAACWRLVYWLLHGGFPAHEVPMLQRLSDWLDGGQWLSTFPLKDAAESVRFCRRLARRRDRFADDQRAALDLLILWLDAAQQPGDVERWLLDADRTWWLCHDPPQGWPRELPHLANELASAAVNGDWGQAAASAGAMFRRLCTCPGVNGWPTQELQDCLQRLCKGC